LINRNKEPEIVEVKALVDSGAGGKFIDQNFAKSLKLKLKKLKKKLPVFNVDGTPNKLGTISYKTKLRLTIGDKRKDEILLVTGLGKQKIILGQPWLKKENPDINWRKGTLTWREEEEETKTATDEERSLKRDKFPAISRIEEVEDDQEWMNHSQNPLEEKEPILDYNYDSTKGEEPEEIGNDSDEEDNSYLINYI
jgi:hypothetical protein